MEHKLDNTQEILKKNKNLDKKLDSVINTKEELIEELESKKEEIRQIKEDLQKEKKTEKVIKRVTENKKETGKVFRLLNKNSLVKYYDDFLSQKNHHFIVPIAGFFDTIFMIIPIDVITIAYLIRHRETKLFPFSIINSISTTLGTFVVYIMGYFFYEQIQNIFSSIGSFFHISPETINYSEIVDKISKHQLVLTFIASMTSTIPFAALAFIAGGLHFNIAYFLIAIFIGRFLKFFTVSYITKYYGPSVLKKVSKNIAPFIFILIALFIIKNILI
jgi:membrane protein YqaA with SNARE-associated domain